MILLYAGVDDDFVKVDDYAPYYQGIEGLVHKHDKDGRRTCLTKV